MTRDTISCNPRRGPISEASSPGGLNRYQGDAVLALNLATAVLYDFYGWLSWVDSEIAFLPYSQTRWA